MTRPDDSRTGRQLHLGYMYWAYGTHPAGWRYPGATFDRAFDPDYLVGLAQKAERAAFDFFFFGDRLATGPDYELTNVSVLARPEPFTMASYLATRTSRIGLAVTANPTYYEPYNLARLVASLDHASGGRASWNIVTGSDPRAAANYTRSEHGDADARYDRADEFVNVVRALWDSWDDDAFIRNQETGEFIDGDKIHFINHVGDAFRVQGPLNVARTPQGQPVVLHAGTSNRSRQLAAREADVIFSQSATVEEGLDYAGDIRRRAAAIGRDPSEIAFLPGLTPIVGADATEARAILDELNALLILDADIRFGDRGPDGWPLSQPLAPREDYGPGYRNLGALSQRIGADVTGISLSDVVTSAAGRRVNAAGGRLIGDASSRTGRTPGQTLTWRDVLHAHVWNGHIVVGGPTEVANYLESWLRAGGSQGFNIQSAFLEQQLDAFIDLVIPVLRERGLFREEYQHTTLRGHLGLPRPPSRPITARGAEVAGR